jgi:hypothetical protein
LVIAWFCRRSVKNASVPPPEPEESVEEPSGGLDDVVAEVRAIRWRISAQFDHDAEKYGEYLMEYQKKFGERLVMPPERKRPSEPPSSG